MTTVRFIFSSGPPRVMATRHVRVGFARCTDLRVPRNMATTTHLFIGVSVWNVEYFFVKRFAR